MWAYQFATNRRIYTCQGGTTSGGGHDVRMEVHGSEGSLAVGLDDSFAFRSAEPGVTFPPGPQKWSFMERFLPAYRAELTAFAQVADALTALSADEDARAAHQRSLSQADENLRLAKVAYERGGGAFLEVLDAQRRVNEGRASLARAEGQRLADAVRLFAATGADWRIEPAAGD